jgi:hypothetical protein
VTKVGTALNVVVPAEAVLVPLAVAGATVVGAGARAPRARVLAAVGLAFVAAQTASLLTSPDTRFPFLYPDLRARRVGAGGERARGARDHRGGPRLHPRAAVRRRAVLRLPGRARAARGPARRLLTRRSPTLDDVERRIAADVPACPPPPGG